MKLIYLAHSRIPTEKAHGLQIMKMCEAFADAGAEVELILPNRQNPISEDPFVFYKTDRIFTIKKLPVIDLVKWGRDGYWISLVSFTLSALFSFLFSREKHFYSRDEFLLFALSFLGHKYVWETHMGRWNFLIQRVIKKSLFVVAITQGLKDYYISQGIPAEKIIVAHDGVDLADFSIDISKTKAREVLGLSKDRKIVVYTGHLYDWKGAHMLAQAAVGIPANTLFVGGTETDVREFKKSYGQVPTIEIRGHRPHHEIPLYLKAADVLVIPNSAKSVMSRNYTSPLKLFEYMTSGTPIVASDLPSLREVLTEREAFFSIPDNSESLAAKITEALTDTESANEKAQKAQEKVTLFTWGKRAIVILDYLKNFKNLPFE